MTDDAPQAETKPIPTRPGERLRAAREAQGLDLGDIAARTRIPQRHLDAIEAGTYASLPSMTYAVGFARAYARAVGLSEVDIAAGVRAELPDARDRPPPTVPVYEIDDPSRTPSRGLAWAGVLVVVLVLVGIALWYGTNLFRGGAAPSSLAVPGGEVAVAIPQTVAPAPPATAGQVTITATDEVWVRIYDAAGTTLLMKTMAPGERYDVPGDADGPMINVGRPDKLSVTVNGSAVPPLGDGRVAIKDVPIGAQVLLARTRGEAAPATAATPAARPTSAARATPTPQPTPSAAPSLLPRAFEAPAGNTVTEP